MSKRSYCPQTTRLHPDNATLDQPSSNNAHIAIMRFTTITTLLMASTSFGMAVKDPQPPPRPSACTPSQPDRSVPPIRPNPDPLRPMRRKGLHRSHQVSEAIRLPEAKRLLLPMSGGSYRHQARWLRPDSLRTVRWQRLRRTDSVR